MFTNPVRVQVPAPIQARENGARLRFYKAHPEIWVAMVLFLASHVYVTCFAKVAHWSLRAESARLEDFCRWDCHWYAQTVDSGYDRQPSRDAGDAANWAFFPLFPLTARALKQLLGSSPAASVVLTSKLAFLTAILAFLYMVRNTLDRVSDYFLAGSLVAFNPYLIYGHAGYTEPLYFTLAALGFWALEQKRWIVAGLFGALLSAARLVGVVFVVAYVIVALRELGLRKILRDQSLSIPIGVLLCPLGMVLFAMYLYHVTGDALAFMHIQAAWGRATTNPIGVLADSYGQHGWLRVWACMAVAAFAVSLWLLPKRPELGVFLGVILLLAVSSGTLYGLPRYIWWQPPLLYFVWVSLKRRSMPWWVIYAAFTCGLASIMVVEWFSGRNFVV